VRLFTGARAAVLKILNPDAGRAGGGAVVIDTALGQLMNEAVSADKVVDIYALAGVETPELSLMSDDFLDSLGTRDKPNLQLGLLHRLLNDQIHTVERTNIVQARRFSEMLAEAINRYTNRSLTTAEIIAELVKMAKEWRDDEARHTALGLTKDEIAFYDAVAANDSAVLELGDQKLVAIARDLVRTVRESATIDWAVKDSVRAAMRSKIRRLLAIHGYPPDMEDAAVELVLEQAEVYAGNESD
jgi:type I restriction enzyme R subunit